MTRVAISSLMVVKKSSLLKRDWRVISCLFSKISFHQNTPGMRKLDPKMRKIINPLFSSNLILKKEKEAVKFGLPSQRLEIQFLSLSYLGPSVLIVTKIFSTWS